MAANLLRRSAVFGALLLTHTAIFSAESSPAVLDKSDIALLANLEEPAPPSPQEIFEAARQRGLSADARPLFALYGEPTAPLAYLGRLEATFFIGRLFAVGGLAYEKLSGETILKMAGKVHQATREIGLPATIEGEIRRGYEAFLRAPPENRAELLQSFTEARSNLLLLLKEARGLAADERASARALGVSLEAGIWSQSLALYFENSREEPQLRAVREILLAPEILAYFRAAFERARDSHPHSPFLSQLAGLVRLAAAYASQPEKSSEMALRGRLAEILGSRE